MPKSTPRIPALRHHKARDLAVVRIDGRDHYLGPFGSAESRECYDRLIREWLARGRASLPKSEATTSGSPQAGPTVTEVIVAYVKFADGYYRKDGRATNEGACIRVALKALRKLYGSTPAAEFGPKKLRAVREEMVAADLCRTEVNKRIGRIVRAFKWAVAEELVPAEVHHGLKALAGLRKGRADVRESPPVRPVPDDHVEAVLPHVSRQVATMIGLQRLTGMRPGEVVLMRTADIDRSGSTWTYVPERHKTEHHGRSRAIFLGPKAQAILMPWLRDDAPDAYLFSPADAMAERKAARRAARKSKVQPSQADRSKVVARRKPGDRFSPMAYWHAIQYGLARANKGRAEAGEPEIPGWHPHQLRHNAATSLRKEFGIEVARVVLGHSSASVTMIYAEEDAQKAAEAMAKVG